LWVPLTQREIRHRNDQLSVTTSYNSISRTVHNLSDVPPHPTLSIVTLNLPTTHAEIIRVFTDHIHANPAKPNKKRVAVIDSIASAPGVTLPWKEMVAICKDEGIWSVIDAAHSIGQEVGINLTESAPDFWVSVRRLNHDRRVVVIFSISNRTATNGFPPNDRVQFCTYPNGRFG